MTDLRTLIDRPYNSKIKNFDLMVAQLSKYLNPYEIDLLVDFMDTIAGSQWDINPTPTDCASQFRIILGSERYEQVVAKWSAANQNLIVDGKKKFIHIATGQVFDGLDETDNPHDYREIYI